ncbi:MAG: PhoPQ-activated protein PqaA family protein [Bryobacterales bacterium]|nr:PhoPQ-activated protein PqaA family protein [Bryobacteraceae bacterium]MDW8353107.1 PhoPQ-activated protein PqaA family protein [Bryobacterales bacterium]
MHARTFASLLVFVAALAGSAQTTALDRYVAQPDGAYSYRRVQTVGGFGYTAHVLELTSQNWRTAAEVDRPLWKHWVTVFAPASVRTRTALLLISGGSNSETPPAPDVALGLAAVSAGAVVAELQQVPNQPLRFAGETRSRSEDAVIAYSWDKFLRTGDELWPAQLPMTKAAVRAMDAVAAFAASSDGGGRTVDRFVVVGASKRGWTTWLAAAVDPRVIAIIPLVIDTLNVEAAFLHHWRAYGFWAPAVRDYEAAGIMTWMGTPQLRSLLALVDPYFYRNRLTMAKYLIHATGDEFFLPDSSQFYFDDLPEPKYLRYVPNTGHGLNVPATADVITNALAFFAAVTGGGTLPRFTWEFPSANGIRVRAPDPPSEVRLWRATNPVARDFRFETIGPTWLDSTVAATVPGVYEVTVPSPPAGWTAFFVELTYTSGGLPLKFTTPVRVVPQTLPFAPPAAVVSAASYLPLVTADSIASAFGENLAGGVAAATQSPLPETLAGVSVRVTDSGGRMRTAPLFFAAPGQVNFLVPAGTAHGLAAVELVRDGRTVTKGQMLVEAVAPALFSANGDGRGVAAGLAVTVKADGSQTWQYLFDAGAPLGARTPVGVDLGGSGDQVYLSLFGTGMRRGSGTVTATVGGEPVGVAGPVAQGQFEGLDQVNLGPLPRTLAGRGEVEIRLVVAGRSANVVTVEMR